MTPSQSRKLGDAAIAQALAASQSHNFFDAFDQSTLFDEVLNWLRGLRTDANYKGFSGAIAKYGLDQTQNPSAALSRHLSALTTDSEEKRHDPFRVAVSNAAKAVLTEVVTQPTTSHPEDTPAKVFGNQFKNVSAKQLTTRYVHSFIYEFLSSVLSRADPERADPVLQEALKASEHSVELIAKRAVERVVSGGRIIDTRLIHRIVHEELQRLADKEVSAVTHVA